MYIRKRTNKSGTTTVYLIDSIREVGKKHASSKVVKCFGSSSEEAVIDTWVKEASALKQRLHMTSSTSRNFVNIKEASDIASCHVRECGIRHFYKEGALSLLSKIRVADSHKKTLIDLALMRIARPVSKLKTANISSSFGIEDMTVNKIYKFMDSLDDGKIAMIKRAVLKNTKDLIGNKIQVMFYDLTTIYFETNSKSDLKEFGFSKDGKSQHVQISMALIVTECGMPIDYEIFKGNIFEGSTLIPTLLTLKERYQQYGIDDITVVADSAMLSNANIASLIKHSFKFIVAARVRNLSKALTEEMLRAEGYSNEDSFACKSMELSKEQRLITVFSEERRRKDAYDREKALDNIRKLEGSPAKAGLTSKLKKPFVKTNKDSRIEIDEDKIKQSIKFDGYFGFITNTDLTTKAVISQYKGLWQVEQSFRITKHNLKIRPVYHYRDRRIKAHFAICYFSFALMRTAEYKLRASGYHMGVEELHQYLERIKEVVLKTNQTESIIRTDIPEEIRDVFSMLGIPRPKRYISECRV